MDNSKIFFTGGSGFIGYHFHQIFNNKKIVNLDLKEPKFNYHSKFYSGDIRKSEDLEKVFQENPEIDSIISLAAEHKDFGIHRDSYFKTNEYGTKQLCEVASKYGIKNIIFYSSVAVYGNNLNPSDEEMKPKPNLPYGESKLAGEKVLQKWQSEDETRSVIIMRPAVVYGERNVANMFRLIDQIRLGRYFHIGAGTNVKSIAYVKNLVNATEFLMNNRRPGFWVYNYADKPQFTSREIATIISNGLGKKDPMTIPYWLAMTLAKPFDLLIKITQKDLPISSNRVMKFCTETYHKADKIVERGYKPKYSNEEGLVNMINWMEGYKTNDEFVFDV